VPPKFISHTIAPVDIKGALWNNEAKLHITCIKSNVDKKWLQRNLGRKGAKMGRDTKRKV